MRTISLFVLLSFLFPFLACCHVTEHAAEGRVFYIDGQSGDDQADGITVSTAWKSLKRLEDLTLEPGDKLLFRRGVTFVGTLHVEARGSAEKRITIGAYGVGAKPRIVAPDSSLYAVQVKNSDYITVENLDIQNKGSERMAYRTGVKVLCQEYGVSKGIVLRALEIHDVNGSFIKNDGGGSGILIENRWKSVVSRFDSLLIEECSIRRTERNAIIWSAPWSRENWHPSTNTVVRKNVIEEVPGDGIVPINCDGVLIEYNLMRNCPATLPETQAAAGFWPWSCDNAVIQFNEVSDHKALWDGQGFDADYNCTNTTIQYNYGHDNHGGFVLICNAGRSRGNIGNIGTKVQYNLSVNDGVRPHAAHSGIFSPTVHICGPVKETQVRNNIFHALGKPNDTVDRSMLVADDWEGYADQTTIEENVFFAAEPSQFSLTQSTNTSFKNNYYLGIFKNAPVDAQQGNRSETLNEYAERTKGVDGQLYSDLLEEVSVGDGQAVIKTIRKDAIHSFFNTLRKGK